MVKKQISLSQPYVYIPVLISLLIFLFSLVGLITLAKLFLTPGKCSIKQGTNGKYVLSCGTVNVITKWDLWSIRFLVFGFVLNAMLPLVFYLLPAVSASAKLLPHALDD